MGWQGYAACSALFAALVAVLAKAGMKDVDSNTAVALRTTVVLAMAWGIVAFRGTGGTPLSAISGRSIVFLALSGAATGLSWLFYFRALDLGEASRVAPVDKLSVVLTTLFAAAFLGETLTAGKVAGVALIAAGALVLLKADPPEKAAAPGASAEAPAEDSGGRAGGGRRPPDARKADISPSGRRPFRP